MYDWEDSFWEKVDKNPQGYKGCWEWTGATLRKGYGQFRRKELKPEAAAHRISWRLTYGEIPKGMCILHKCDNPPCVRPDHLFLGTKKENSQDMTKKRRHRLQQHPELKVKLQGENNPRAKLVPDQVREIRKRYDEGENTVTLSNEFGVETAAISKIGKRQRWRSLPE